jgi:FkbM family methyltransferase
MTDLINTPRDSGLIFDVGLHRGEGTDFYLQKNFRVVAVEANPEHADFCRTRFKTAIDQNRLKIIQGAIVDAKTLAPQQRKISFYRNESGSGWGTIRSDWAERNRKADMPSTLIEVDIIDFTEVLVEHGIPHYMKVDIEGCDMICVEALRRFRERPAYVSIESDKTSLKAIRHEIDQLASLGYDMFQAVEQSAVEALAPPFPAREGNYVPHHFDSASSGLFGAELNGRWFSRSDILRLYRFIRIGYYLLGDDGILNVPKLPGASLMRSWTRRILARFTHAAVPGWYDTHARHSSATGIAP